MFPVWPLSTCVLVEDTLPGVAGRGHKIAHLVLFAVFCVFLFFQVVAFLLFATEEEKLSWQSRSSSSIDAHNRKEKTSVRSRV